MRVDHSWDSLIRRDSVVCIEARITSASEIMELLVLMDALKRIYPKGARFDLLCPYLPYARQDRVCAKEKHYLSR